MKKRFYVTAEGSGWAVRDGAQTVDAESGRAAETGLKLGKRVDFFGSSESVSFAAAMRAAHRRCAELNAEEPGDWFVQPEPDTEGLRAVLRAKSSLIAQLQEDLRLANAATLELVNRGADLTNAILDIDAHATPFGSDDDGFVNGGYLVSVGAVHRALGVVGRSAGKCPTCQPETHDCETPF